MKQYSIVRWVCRCITVIFVLTSCNTISEDERLIFVKPPQAARNVLIEDFTGQRCINCPNAALEIEKLKEEYGDSTIISVGIHSGPLALYSRGSVLGLRTEEGDAYYDHWGIEQEPIGYINRRGTVATVDQWATLVREAIQVPSEVSMSLDATYDSIAHKADISLKVIHGTPFDGYVQLWLTESNITALQMMPDGSANQSYVHQHVFRRTINGQWGDVYKAEAGAMDYLEYSCELDEAWNPEQMAVVAFVYNEDGVQQVTEGKLVINR